MIKLIFRLTILKFKRFSINVREFFFNFIIFLISLKNMLGEIYLMHIFILKRDGMIIYFKYLKYNVNPVLIFYIFYFLTRGCLSLSMLPVKIVEETSVDCLTNGVIDHIVKNTNMEGNIVSIPNQKLERKLPHDVNIFNIYKNELSFNEIKVLVEKKKISENELVDLRFRYSYVKNIYIGFHKNIEDSDIIKNINKINEQKNIVLFFEDNFEKNRVYYRNKFLLNVNREVMNDILRECDLPLDVKKVDFIKIINECDKNIRIVNNRINYILENRNKINSIININEKLLNEKYLIREEIYKNEEEKEFFPKIKSVKIDSQQQQIKYKSGIIEKFRYNENSIQNRVRMWDKILRNLKK